MLDADQEIRPELLRYHMKFRFWFQELKVTDDKPSHINLPRIYPSRTLESVYTAIPFHDQCRFGKAPS
jgi:hypothetical protein